MEEELAIAGLSLQQSKTYLKLLDFEYVNPSDFCFEIDEARSNTYKILDELVDKGLANKVKKNKKFVYAANSPSLLGQMARVKRDEIDLQEKNLNAKLPELIDKYHKTHEQPGIRFFQGMDGIEEIFKDQVFVNKPIYFQLSPQAIDYYGFKKMHELRMLAVKAEIPRFAIVADNPKATKNYKQTDKQYFLERTWLKHEDYTAPTEWGVYGDKMYIISFGKDAMGLIIDSPAVAEGFKQLYALLVRLQKNQVYYKSLPEQASNIQPIL